MRAHFEDFLLLVNEGAGHYTVEARGPGEARSAPVPLRYEETPALREAIAQLQGGKSLPRDRLELLGSHLYTALFPPDVARTYASVSQSLPDGSLLRIRLDIRPLALARLPWELLLDPHSGTFLALRPDRPLLRHVMSTEPIEALELHTAPRILQVEAQPTDRTLLDELERSRTALVRAWQKRAEVVTLVASTPEQLREEVSGAPGFHILHYEGYLAVVEGEEGGALVLLDREGEPHPLGARALADTLQGTPTRAVILTACLTGRHALERRFTDIAPQLARHGRVPAVVAMQFPLCDEGARAFVEGFYGALAAGHPLEVALGWGRLAIRQTVGDDSAEWAAPLLLLRGRAGDIFVAEPGAEPLPSLAPPSAPSEPVAALEGNPFTPGEIVPAQRFVGRQQTLERIATHLGDLDSLFVVGAAGIGKSSLLAYLTTALPALLREQGHYLPLYLNLDELREPAPFMRALLAGLLPHVIVPPGKEQLVRELERRVSQHGLVSLEEMARTLEWARDRGLRVVLLLDGGEALHRAPAFEGWLREALRPLYRERRVAMLLALPAPPEEAGLKGYAVQDVTALLTLGPLPPNEATALLSQPHDRPFSEAEIALGLEVAQGNPLRLQAAGYWLYQWKRQWNSPLYIGPEELHPDAYNILHRKVQEVYAEQVQASPAPTERPRTAPALSSPLAHLLLALLLLGTLLLFLALSSPPS